MKAKHLILLLVFAIAATQGATVWAAVPTSATVTYSKASAAYHAEPFLCTVTFDISVTAASLTVTGDVLGDGSNDVSPSVPMSADGVTPTTVWTFSRTIATTTDDGPFSILVEGDGTELTPIGSTFAIDTSTPVMSFAFEPSDRIYRNETIFITATFDEDITPTSPSIVGVGLPTGTGQNDFSGTMSGLDLREWSFSRSFLGSSVQDGTFTITVTASDAAGNQAAQPLTRTFEVDTRAPEVPTLTYSRGPGSLVAGPFTVTADFNEALTSTITPTLEFDLPANFSPVTATALRVGDQQVIYSTTIVGPTAQAGAAYSAWVTNSRVVDRAGNEQVTGNAGFSGVVDTEPPAPLPFVFSRFPAFLNEGPLRVTADFNEPLSGTVTPTLVFDLAANFSPLTATSTRVSPTRMVFDTSVTNPTSPNGDPYAATMTFSSVVDVVGNPQTPPSAVFAGVADTISPTVTLLQYSKSSRRYLAETFQVTVTFSEPITPNAPTIAIAGGTGVGNDVGVTSLTHYSGLNRWTFSRAVNSGVDDGVFDLTLTASDPSGNAMTVQPPSTTFFIDTAAPAGPTLTFSRGPAYVMGGSWRITADFSEPITLGVTPTLTFTVPANITPTPAVPVRISSTQIVYATTATGTTLDDGTPYTATVDRLTVLDLAGNVQPAPDVTASGRVDTVAPHAPGLVFSRGPTYLTTGAFSVTLTSNEPLISTITPTLTFDPAGNFSPAAPVPVRVTGSNDTVFVYNSTVVDTGGAPAGIGYDATVAKATVVDRSGNAQTADDTNVGGTVDTYHPTATLTYDQSDRIYSAEPFVLTVTFDEPVDTTTPIVQISGGQANGSNDVNTQLTGGGATWTLSRTVVGGGVDDGSFTITLTAYDRAGNRLDVQPGSRTFSIDTVAPSAPTLAFSRGPAYLSAGSLSVTADFAESIESTPTLTFSRSVNFNSPAPVASRISPTRFVYTSTVYGLTGQAGESYTATVARTSVIDLAGNVQTAPSAAAAGVVDTNLPLAPTLTFSSGPAYLRAGFVTITADFVEPISTNPTLTFTSAFIAPVSPDPSRLSSTRFVYLTNVGGVTAQGGTAYTAKVDKATVKDLSGNTQTAADAAFSGVVDTVPPVASLTFTRGNNGAYLNAGQLDVLADFNEALTGTVVPVLTFDATPNFTSPATANTISSTQVRFVTNVGGSTAQAGNPYLATLARLSVVDLAGNPASTDTLHSGVVDTNPPSGTLTFSRGLYNGGYVNAGPLAVTANFNEPITNTVTPTLSYGTSPYFTPAVPTPARISSTQFGFATTVSGTTAASGQSYSATIGSVTVMDLAGNNALANLVKLGTVDTVAPVASLAYSRPSLLYTAGLFALTCTFSEDLTPVAPAIAIAGGTASPANDAAGPLTLGPNRRTWVFSRTISSTADDGSFSLTLTASDPSANLLTVMPPNRVFQIDTQSPAAPSLTVVQNRPGTDDRVRGQASESNVTLRVYPTNAKASVIVGGFSSDGAYDLSIGDNTQPSVFVTALDAAGNESAGAAGLNDILAPASLTATALQNPPGTADRVAGSSDEPAGWIRVYTDSARLSLVTTGFASAGAFSLAIGDNTRSSVFVTATDAVGNESAGLSISNDIVSPTAPSVEVRPQPPGAADRVLVTAEAGSTIDVWADPARTTRITSATAPTPELLIGDNLHAIVYVTATDGRANVSAVTAGLNDVAAPVTPTVAVVQNRPGLADRVRGTVETGAWVRVYAGSAPSGSPLTATTAHAGGFDLTIGETTPLLAITATDLAGNVSPAATAANDVSAPITPTLTVVQNAPGTADRAQGVAEPGAQVTVYTSAGMAQSIAEAGALSPSGAYDIAIGDNLRPFVFVTARDAAGNEGPGIGGFNDIAGPAAVLSLSRPAPLGAGPLSVTATFAEPLASSPSWTLLRGAGPASSGPMQRATGPAGIYTLNTFLMPADGAGILDAPFALTVTAHDSAANPGGATIAPALDTRLGFSFPIRKGLNLVSLPVRPAWSLNAADITTLTSASFVSRTVAGADGRSRFEVYLPGPAAGRPFVLEPGAGYALHGRRPLTWTVAGATAWPPSVRRHTFVPGINLVGLPSVLSRTDVPLSLTPTALVTAGELMRAAASPFASTPRRDGEPGSVGAVEGLTSPLSVCSGLGYVVGFRGPAAAALDLPMPGFNPPGRPPVVSAGADRVVTYPETATAQLSGTATDPDGDLRSFEWLQLAGPAVTLVSPNSLITSFTLPRRADYSFLLRAVDATGLSGVDVVEVRAVNRGPAAPTARLDTTGSILTGTQVRLSATASDPDGDPLTYTWRLISAPAGVSAAVAASGAASTVVVPARGQGTYQVGVSVSDDAGRASPEATVSFTVANQAPRAALRRTDSHLLVTRASLEFDGRASSDPDGDPLTYSWSVAPSTGVTLTGATTSQCSLAVPPGAEGTYQLQLIVRDGSQNSAPATTSFTVAANRPPSVSILPAIASVGSVVLMTAVATDPDGETPLRYSWRFARLPMGASANELSATTAAVARFTPTRPGLPDGSNDYELEVTVSDPREASFSATARISLRARYLQRVQVPGRTVEQYVNLVDGSSLVRLPAAPELLFGTLETSNGQYRNFVSFAQFVGSPELSGTPDSLAAVGLSGDEQPVLGVSQTQAAAYGAWAGMRLPSELEWLTAATGVLVTNAESPPARLYPWGSADPATTLGLANLGGDSDGFVLSSGVSALPAGATPDTGIFGLAGNAEEWTTTALSGQTVVRGGSYLSTSTQARNSTSGRFSTSASSTAGPLGFRCVMSYDATAVVP